jgi:predicted alpha/beta superfamily hydrolase
MTYAVLYMHDGDVFDKQKHGTDRNGKVDESNN